MSNGATPSDLYMNFLECSVTMNASNSSTLESSAVNTGLSIRGQLAFLIHKIEVVPPYQGNTEEVIRYAISTRDDLSTMPSLGDKGTVFHGHQDYRLATSGAIIALMPHVFDYLPPVPVASPKLVAYVQTAADDSSYRGLELQMRIGFTTVKIDSRMYAELAETWGFSN